MNFSSILKAFVAVVTCGLLCSESLTAQSLRLVEVDHNFADCDGLVWASFYPDSNSVVFAGCFDGFLLQMTRWNIGEDTVAVSIADSAAFSPVSLSDVSWNRDSSVLLTGGIGVVLWDSKSWDDYHYMPDIGNLVTHVNFAPNNKDVVVLTWYGIAVVDVKTGEILRTIGDQSFYPKRGMDMSSDGSRLAVVTDSGDVWMYDYESGEKLWSVKRKFPVYNVQFHPYDSRVLIIGLEQEGALHFIEAVEYDVNSGEKIMNYTARSGPMYSARYNREGTRIVTTSYFDSLVHVWSTETGEMLAVTKFGDVVQWAEFSKEGNRIVVAGGRRVGVWELQPSSSVSEPVAGERVNGRLDVHPNPVGSMLTVPFTLPGASDVHLVLYDMMGKEVQILASAEYDAGEHRIVGDLSTIPSGPYLVVLRSEEGVLYRQIQVIH